MSFKLDESSTHKLISKIVIVQAFAFVFERFHNFVSVISSLDSFESD